MKCFKSILVLMLVGILASAFATADAISGEDGVDVTITSVEVNDVELSTTTTKNLEKTDELDILVVFSINKSIDDVEIEAELTGYDNSDRDKVNDQTDTFDVKAGNVYDKRLNLELPVRFEQDTYSLKIRFETPKGTLTQRYLVDINTQDHMIEIRDIVLSPESEVKAGRALLVTARIKNRGESEEEDIKVKASVPALGISASDYLDRLDPEDCTGSDCDDSTTSEELYMRIPDCAEPGQYTVKVSVEYDDGDEEVIETTKINVVESDTCAVRAEDPVPTTGKTVITIGPETQDIVASGSATYPVTIANQGTESRTYSISADSADWAEFTITPSNVLVVGAGDSKAAFISVKPKSSASTGLQVFSVTIKSGETVLKQVPLRANIVGGKSVVSGLGLGSVKKALEIGLVILVVLLVILGLIIGFNKLKGNEEDEEQGDEKTYY